MVAQRSITLRYSRDITCSCALVAPSEKHARRLSLRSVGREEFDNVRLNVQARDIKIKEPVNLDSNYYL